MTGRRAQEDRAVVDGTKQFDTHVDLGGIPQTPWTQLDMLISFTIGAQRGIVVHATHHESPMAVADLAVRGLLEIENVEGFGRRGDHIGSSRGFRSDCLSQAALLEESSDSAERGNIRAGGQKFKKFATSRRGINALAHAPSFFGGVSNAV